MKLSDRVVLPGSRQIISLNVLQLSILFATVDEAKAKHKRANLKGLAKEFSVARGTLYRCLNVRPEIEAAIAELEKPPSPEEEAA